MFLTDLVVVFAVTAGRQAGFSSGPDDVMMEEARRRDALPLEN